MINQGLINQAKWDLEKNGRVRSAVALELIKAYKNLIKDNAELHKELAKLRGAHNEQTHSSRSK